MAEPYAIRHTQRQEKKKKNKKVLMIDVPC